MQPQLTALIRLPTTSFGARPRLMEAEQRLELQLEADQRLELLLGDADAQDPETMADWLIWKAL